MFCLFCWLETKQQNVVRTCGKKQKTTKKKHQFTFHAVRSSDNVYCCQIISSRLLLSDHQITLNAVRSSDHA